MQDKEALLRQIPNVDRLLKNKIVVGCGLYRHEILEGIRAVLDRLRDDITGCETDAAPDDDTLAAQAVALASQKAFAGIRRVVNGTGVILHSNLGRARMSEAAARAAAQAAAQYCTLEYDVEKGARGSRTGCVEERLRGITGCEAALIVNNNAAAMLLILATVASGGNVVVSRGELVEIGGGFRIPDIIKQSGCRLCEVGTTNKTNLSDYEEGVDFDTRALLRVHASNYKIVGFTESVSLKDLIKLRDSSFFNFPVIEDIGSGALVDMRRYGIHGEPFAPESLKDGADIVSFSGDKLLGGPQCGIILGRENYVADMKKHPLYRALRPDKMTVAALEATLRVYMDPSAAEKELPVLVMLSLTDEALRLRAEGLCSEILNRGGHAKVIKTKSVAGGGAVPGLELDSYAVVPLRDVSEFAVERALRALSVPIIGRIEKHELLLDVRTMLEEDFGYIADAVAGTTII